MKKAIALFSVTTLLVVGIAAQASTPQTTATGNDDTVIVNSSMSRAKRVFKTNQFYSGDSSLVVNVNSGKNARVAGGDLEGGSTSSGNLTFVSNDTSTINSSDVWIDEPAPDTSDDSVVTATSNDDTAIVQNNDEETEDRFNTESVVYESDNSAYNFDSGNNLDAAGEDIEEGAGGITSGSATVTINRTRLRGMSQITYGSLLP